MYSTIKKVLISCTLTLIIASYFSCSENDSEYTAAETTYHPDFLPYIDHFIAKAELRELEFNRNQFFISYGGSIPDDAVGYCFGTNVAIDKSYWDSADECLREFLVFHEFGHCLLAKAHNNTTINNQWSSLMHGKGDGFPNSTIDKFKFYGHYKDYYLDELFLDETDSTILSNHSAILESVVKTENLYTENNVNLEYLEMDLPSENYIFEIFINDITEHKPLEANGSGIQNIESITLKGTNAKFSFNLIGNVAHIKEECFYDIDLSNDYTKISLVTKEDHNYIFIGEEHLTTTTLLGNSLIFTTQLITGIDSIQISLIE